MEANGRHALTRRSSLAGILGVVALAVAACGGSTASSGSASPSTPINVAVILPLTGAHAPFGTALADGAEAGAYVINQDGGVLGRKINVIAQSDGSDPLDSVTLARNMLARYTPSMFIAFGGNDYQNSLPVVANSHTVIFADVGDPAIDHQTNPYVFRAVPSDSLTGTSMAYWASKQGYKRVALVFDAAQGGQTLVPPIQDAAAKLGLQIVSTGSTSLALSQPSYETTVQNVINAHPQALLMQLTPADAGTFFHELDALGGQNIPVIGSDSTSTAQWVQAIGDAAAARQLISVVAATGSISGAAGQLFTSAFRHLFNAPPRSLSDSDYDAIIIGALAMDAAKSSNPTVFDKYVTQVTTPGNGHVTVSTYAQGLKLLNEGKKIDYVGLSSPWIFNQYHAITAEYDVGKTLPSGNLQVTATISPTALAKLLA